ncbi:hypothetical protein B484DRAFT_407531 [Ochromonadaceae sp. CCMP2298]|nr:hypothetical protein B484DRAFT_407531 [Ochromonadaceae sp. CCMP2298]
MPWNTLANAKKEFDSRVSTLEADNGELRAQLMKLEQIVDQLVQRLGAAAERLVHVEGHCSSLERDVAGDGSAQMRTLSEAMGKVEEDITELKSLKRRVDQIEGAPRGAPAQRVRHSSGPIGGSSSAEAWSSKNVVLCLLEKKKLSLNKVRCEDEKASCFLFRELLSLCVDCYRAGCNPEQCIFFAGLHGFQMHRRNQSCHDCYKIVGKEAFSNKKGKAAAVQLQSKFEPTPDIEKVHWIYVRVPGSYYVVDYLSKSRFAGIAAPTAAGGPAFHSPEWDYATLPEDRASVFAPHASFCTVSYREHVDGQLVAYRNKIQLDEDRDNEYI